MNFHPAEWRIYNKSLGGEGSRDSIHDKIKITVLFNVSIKIQK
jgi:hypothetical protein